VPQEWRRKRMIRFLRRGRGTTFAALVGIGFFIAVACTGVTPTATPWPTATTEPAPTATLETQEERAQRLETALLQSYFLSVDNFAGPVMLGGIGIPFMPPMENIQILMAKAGLAPEMMAMSPGMVLAIYASAEPRLAPELTPEMGPPADLATMRWDTAGIDTAIQTRDRAMLIMKFVEWAKYFHKAWEDEAVLSPPPLERMLSNVFIVEPLMIVQFASQNLMAESGFVRAITMEDGQRVVADGSIDPFDQASMLRALSDLVLTMKSADTYPNLQVQPPGMDDPILS
jgi:hypothetical protein